MGYRGGSGSGGGGSPQMMVPPFKGVVKTLVIACAVIWLFGQLILDRMFLGGQFFNTYFALVPSLVLEKFYIWQLVTYAFLHSASPFHVALNMLSLWFIGSELEQRWGSRFFLVYYLVCAVGAAFIYVTIILLYAASKGSLALAVTMTPVLGASGAIFGLLLAYGILFGERVIYFIVFPIKAKYFVMILGGLEIVNLIDTGVGGSEVASLCHLGGIASGYLFLMMNRQIQARKVGAPKKAASKSKLKLVINNDKKKEDPKYWN